MILAVCSIITFAMFIFSPICFLSSDCSYMVCSIIVALPVTCDKPLRRSRDRLVQCHWYLLQGEVLHGEAELVGVKGGETDWMGVNYRGVTVHNLRHHQSGDC